MTEDQAVSWMAKHGKTCYQDSIAELESTKRDILCEAGPLWAQDEYTVRIIAMVDSDIADTKRQATDRIADWESD